MFEKPFFRAWNLLEWPKKNDEQAGTGDGEKATSDNFNELPGHLRPSGPDEEAQASKLVQSIPPVPV
jgi:hypothetical protein